MRIEASITGKATVFSAVSSTLFDSFVTGTLMQHTLQSVCRNAMHCFTIISLVHASGKTVASIMSYIFKEADSAMSTALTGQ